MLNKSLFASRASRTPQVPGTCNAEGAPAYALSAKEALAQFAMTGCLRHTFYEGADTQLESVLELCAGLEAGFIARVAVVSRERGRMKDLPALLCAVLASRQDPEFERAFPRVIDNARALRSFVQIVRSGITGRRSLGSRPRRLVREWFESRSDDAVFRGSVGTSPSLADVIRLAHPRPGSPGREALYAYLVGARHDAGALPERVREFEAFKRDRTRPLPDLPFEMLTALQLDRGHWVQLARRASWQTTRANLNTFARHGVFQAEGLADQIAARLSDPGAVARSRVLPHSIQVAIAACDGAVPAVVRGALETALEASLSNVPRLRGVVVICPDLSGSMSSPVSGRLGGATTAVRCVDVAALFTAALLRANPLATVLPFSDDVLEAGVRAPAPLSEISRALASRLGGGTRCSAPLAWLNARGATADVVIMISDNESWLDDRRLGATELMCQWESLRARNPGARLVCLDLQPNRSTQAFTRSDILNVGGFSDSVFEAIAGFADNATGASLVTMIEQAAL